MKPVDVKSSMYNDFNKENNKQGPKFKAGDNVIEYENLRIYLQNVTFHTGLEKVLWLKKFKTLCHGHILLVALTEKKFLERFKKKNFKKQIKKIERLIKRKGDKLYVRWKSYCSSFNSLIDKKDIV